MYCPNCAAELPTNANFCIACGTPLQANANARAAATKRQPYWIAFLILGIAVLVFFTIWQGGTGDHEDGVQQIRRYATGQDFSVGYWSYRCNGATWQPFIYAYGSIERPDAEFLILSLVAKNNDRTASTLPPVKLVDSQGREFSQSSKEALLEGSFGMLKELNPGVSSTGLVLFDVPPGEYSVKLSGGFQSQESAFVILPTEKKSTPENSQVAPSTQSSLPPSESVTTRESEVPPPDSSQSANIGVADEDSNIDENEIRGMEQHLFGKEAVLLNGYTIRSKRSSGHSRIIEFCKPNDCDNNGGMLTSSQSTPSGDKKVAGILYDNAEVVVYLGDYGYEENLPPAVKSWLTDENLTERIKGHFKNVRYVYADKGTR